MNEYKEFKTVSAFLDCKSDDPDVLYWQDSTEEAVECLEEVRNMIVSVIGNETVSAIEKDSSKLFLAEVEFCGAVVTRPVSRVHSIRSENDIKALLRRNIRKNGVSTGNLEGALFVGGRGFTPYAKRLYDLNYRVSKLYEALNTAE